MYKLMDIEAFLNIQPLLGAWDREGNLTKWFLGGNNCFTIVKMKYLAPNIHITNIKITMVYCRNNGG